MSELPVGAYWTLIYDPTSPLLRVELSLFGSPHLQIAGLVPGGGLGINQRPLGLTIDRVTSYDIINADGQLKHVTPTTDADLFWCVLTS